MKIQHRYTMHRVLDEIGEYARLDRGGDYAPVWFEIVESYMGDDIWRKIEDWNEPRIRRLESEFAGALDQMEAE